jgi:hypothetical protein
MLEARSQKLDSATTRVSVLWNGEPASVRSALDMLRSNELFRSELIAVLAESPFAAYFWETPPVTKSSFDQPFEFVLSDAHALAKAAPDTGAFQEHFERDDDHDGVVVFENLGRDATLVVPCPLVRDEAYVHLAAFLRGAPAAQSHALFRCVADEVLRRVSDQPLWVSTAGMGIYWLHVRLDSRPKYYRHVPYKSFSESRS